MNTGIRRNSVGDAPPSFLRSPLGTVTIVALVLGGALLLWSERPDVLSWLPWLVVLACPLLHVIMHRHHRSGATETEHIGTEQSESSVQTHRH
jgi:hypothetical protein